MKRAMSRCPCHHAAKHASAQIEVCESEMRTGGATTRSDRRVPWAEAWFRCAHDATDQMRILNASIRPNMVEPRAGKDPRLRFDHQTGFPTSLGNKNARQPKLSGRPCLVTRDCGRLVRAGAEVLRRAGGCAPFPAPAVPGIASRFARGLQLHVELRQIICERLHGRRPF